MNKETTIGFLPLYLDLYQQANPDLLNGFTPLIEKVRDLLAVDGFKVASAPPAYEPSHVRALADRFSSADVIVTLHLCYSPSLLVAEYLADTGKPLLVLDATPDPSMENMPDDFLMKNHGIHGVMDLTSVLYNRGVDYTVISGHPDQPGFGERVSSFLGGVRAGKLLRGQTIGITGKPFAGMGDFAVDFTFLKERLQIDTIPIDKESIVRATREVSGSAIEEQRQRDMESCVVSDIDQEIHKRDIRSYIAIRELLDEKGATGYTMNFQHVVDEIPVPFYACSRLQSLGYGYGGEGDVLTAALGCPLNAVAVSKFDEFFCPDWARNGILMSHMGETDPRFADGEIRLGTRTGFVNEMESAIFRFQAKPGCVTFINLTPGRDRDFKIVTGILDIVEFPVLDQIVGPHYVVRTRGSLTDFLERYAAVGGGHHLYISRGNIVPTVKTMCGILDFELHEIG